VPLYWCAELNLPVLDVRKIAGKCNVFTEVKLTQPADPRPAFPADIEITREAIVNEFGDAKLAEVLIPMDEVVCSTRSPVTQTRPTKLL
jgi:phosphoadenosine phosphosulfate reductase